MLTIDLDDGTSRTTAIIRLHEEGVESNVYEVVAYSYAQGYPGARTGRTEYFEVPLGEGDYLTLAEHACKVLGVNPTP